MICVLPSKSDLDTFTEAGKLTHPELPPRGSTKINGVAPLLFHKSDKVRKRALLFWLAQVNNRNEKRILS